MKNYRQIHLILLLGVMLHLISSCSKADAVDVDYSFASAVGVKQKIKNFNKVDFESFEHLDLGFFEGDVWVQLEIENKPSYASYMVMMDDLINRNYRFYKLNKQLNSLKPIDETVDHTLTDDRTYNNPKPNFQIDLTPNEKATFIITTKSDGRILQATPHLLSVENYTTINNRLSLFNYLFYVAIFMLLLINIFHWSILKNNIYYFYAFYILSSCLFYLNVEGQLYGLGLSNSAVDHLLFVSIRIWIFAAVLFTSKFLEINKTMPTFWRFIKAMLIIILGGATLYQFVFYNTSISQLHVIENYFGFFWIIIALLIIFLSFKERRMQAKYYLIAFSFLLFFITLGLVDSHFTILPGDPFSYFKIGTIIEYTGFTYFIVLIIKTQFKKTLSLERELVQRKEELVNASQKQEARIDKTDLLPVFKLVENSLSSESDWDEFKSKLEKLNPNFLDHILVKHPELTKSEIRLLILIRIGYSQKEIAGILNIAPASVKKARSRVRKKLNLTEDQSLKELLAKS